MKDELWLSIPPFQRDARSKGIPALGSGAIYPIPESEVRVQDFEIPMHWPRAYALDNGWNNFAVVWGALDRETGILCVQFNLQTGTAEPAVHIDAIKNRGAWIPGVGDAADIDRHDGQQTIDIFRRAGLDLILPDKAVEAGICDVWTMLSTGRLKVFASCAAWFEEYRLYRRDENGKIVKRNDHLLDCTRYLVRSGIARMKPHPTTKRKPLPLGYHPGRAYRPSDGLRWMA